MIEPPPLAFIKGIAYLQVSIMLRRLIANT